MSVGAQHEVHNLAHAVSMIASTVLNKGMELAVKTGMKFYSGYMGRFLAELALQRGPAQLVGSVAAPQFEASIATLASIKAENELAHAYAGCARLRLLQDRTAEAREYFTRALEIFDRLGTLGEPDRVRFDVAEMSPATGESPTQAD